MKGDGFGSGNANVLQTIPLNPIGLDPRRLIPVGCQMTVFFNPIDYVLAGCRFPNLCVAVITRESARQAFRGGITASQIIRFLNMQAHPKVRTPLPSPAPPPPVLPFLKKDLGFIEVD
jgi:hypothetical protein